MMNGRMYRNSLYDRAFLGSLFTLPIRITGNGTLSVAIDGVTVDYAGPREVFPFDKRFDTGTHALSFVYTPGENDAGGAYLSRFARNDGLKIIFR